MVGVWSRAGPRLPTRATGKQADDDFGITFFTAGAGTVTLPLQMHALIKIAVPPVARRAAASALWWSLVLIVVAARISPSLLRTR